jgi:hypothetical protein
MRKGDNYMPKNEKDSEASDKMKMIERISRIFSVFAKQEMGNRITQFNIQGLTDIIITSITNPEEVVLKDGNISKK